MERLCSDLFVACDDGDVDETLSLLKMGADPNHTSSRGGYVGNYPIHAAARSKSYRCVVALVEAGARLDLRRKDGWTALHNAVMRRDYEIVHYLLEQRPTLVLLKDENGNTPVDLAISKSVSDDIVQLLKDKRRWCIENEDLSKLKISYNGEKKKMKSSKKKSKFPKFFKNIARTLRGPKKPIVKRKISGTVRDAIKNSVIRRIKSGDDSKTQWKVKLSQQSPPLIAQTLLRAFRDLMTQLYNNEKESLDTAKDDSDLINTYNGVKEMLKLPLVLQHENFKMREESEDQIFRDLRREVIVVNGQLFDLHIAMKAEDAMRELRGVIGNAIPDNVDKDAVVKWVLLACTRTLHGGDVHSILHELVNDSEDSMEDMHMAALVRALEQGDISKSEFETIQSKALMTTKSSTTSLPICPIVPSHSASQALTHVIISTSEILVLASSAFDVGVPSKFVFQTTLQMKFDLEKSLELDRELVVCLHKTQREVSDAIKHTMGSSSTSRSLPLLIPKQAKKGLRSRLGSDVDKEVVKLRDLTYSVTPLLDAAKELKERINQRNDKQIVDDQTKQNEKRSIDVVEKRNRELRIEIKSLKQERDAALSLLLRAGEQQAELLRVQKESRRKSDLSHSRQIRVLRDTIEDKDTAINTLRAEVSRLRSLI